RKQVWLVTQDYDTEPVVRLWLGWEGFHLLLSHVYFGDARIELFDRGLPSALGPTVLPDSGFRGWRGSASVHRRVATTAPGERLARSFQVRRDSAYVVAVQSRGAPP